MKKIIHTLLATSMMLFSNIAQAAVANIGDELMFSKADLENAQNIQKIEWKQGGSNRTENYVQISTIVNSDTPYVTVLFVQKVFVKLLVENSCVEDDCRVTIDDRFQYGQNKEATVRFLVLHDKLNVPYQHRFLTTNALTSAANGAESAAKVATKFGVVVPQAAIVGKASEETISGLKSIVGDPLRDY